jgi:hypothetical protein
MHQFVNLRLHGAIKEMKKKFPLCYSSETESLCYRSYHHLNEYNGFLTKYKIYSQTFHYGKLWTCPPQVFRILQVSFTKTRYGKTILLLFFSVCLYFMEIAPRYFTGKMVNLCHDSFNWWLLLFSKLQHFLTNHSMICRREVLSGNQLTNSPTDIKFLYQAPVTSNPKKSTS